jgi:quinol monooxygenase YgiN
MRGANSLIVAPSHFWGVAARHLAFFQSFLPVTFTVVWNPVYGHQVQGFVGAVVNLWRCRMSVLVLLDFRVKPDVIEESKRLFEKLLPETRAHPGCEGLDVYSNAEDPTNILFYERWESKEHYQEYFTWRTGSGAMDEFGKKLAGAPTIRYFNRLDI